MARGQRDGWRMRHLWREANRNVFSRHSRLLLLLCFGVLTAAGTSAFAAYQWASFTDALAVSALHGRNTIAFQSADVTAPAEIDRGSCEALIAQPGVVHAGGVSLIGSDTFAQLGPAVQVYAASPTLLPQLAVADVVVGRELGFTGDGRLLLMPDGSTLVAAEGREEPAGLNLGSAVAVPMTPTQKTVERCVVTLDRFVDATEATPRISSSLRATGGAVAATSEFSENTDPVDAFVNRPDRYLPVVLGVLCGIVGLGMNRFRSSDIASYRFSGTAVRSMFLLLFFEQSLLAGSFAAAGSLALAFIPGFFVQPSAQIPWVLAGAAAWLIVATTNLPLSRGDPSSLSKDR